MNHLLCRSSLSTIAKKCIVDTENFLTLLLRGIGVAAAIVLISEGRICRNPLTGQRSLRTVATTSWGAKLVHERARVPSTRLGGTEIEAPSDARVKRAQGLLFAPHERLE